MDKALQQRFAILAALLFVLIAAGTISLPLLQRCCPDPPPFWPETPNRSLLETLILMDMLPRLAGLAVAAGAASLALVAGIYAATAKAEQREAEGRSAGSVGLFRAVAAAFAVGVLYLFCLFGTGYFRLGWFNLMWIIGVPVLLATLTGRDEFERRWGGLFLIIPGFVAQMVLMTALGIGLY